MGGVQEGAQGGGVGGDGRPDPCVLGHDVADAGREDRRQGCLDPGEVVGPQAAQGRDPEEAGSLLALGAPGVVSGSGQGAGDTGVDHDEGHARGEAHGLHLERFTVEEQGVAGATAGDGHLVHGPAGDAEAGELRPAAGGGDVQRWHLPVRGRRQRHGEADLERCRGREAGALRKVPGDSRSEAGEGAPESGELRGHGPGEAGPGRVSGRGSDWEGRRRLVARRGKGQDAAPGVGGNDHLAVDRRREAEPVVVVGVFAQDVHAPRRAHHDRGVLGTAGDPVLGDRGGDGVAQSGHRTAILSAREPEERAATMRR